MSVKLESLSKREVVFDALAAIDLLRSPRRFETASFESYLPNPDYPSQDAAKIAAMDFAAVLGDSKPPKRVRRHGWRFVPGAKPGGRGIYFDGGFGVGKTHLLVALHRIAPKPKAFCSFIDLVNFVGALGFEESLLRLGTYSLIAIDEFELDDPGDTVLISTLLTRLCNQGVNLAATSNTLPDKLGEGRFAAVDFVREIQGLAARFSVISIDGGDYRRLELHLEDYDLDLSRLAISQASSRLKISYDSFDALNAKLASLHPVMYSRLLDGIDVAIVSDATRFDALSEALRFVVLVDRAYEMGVAVLFSGAKLADLFPSAFLTGGFGRKFGRCLSRLSQLRDEALPKLHL